MNFEADSIYHIYNRGNQQQKIFFKSENYRFFLRKIRKELLPHCTLLAYCLMPNHFHLMVEIPQSVDGEGVTHRMTHSHPMGYSFSRMHPLSQAIAVLLRSYTRAIQKQENFTGSLFQQKTKAVEILTERQILICTNYIHRNPIKACLVNLMEDWEFSSFQAHCDIRDENLCNKARLRELLQLKVEDDFYKYSYETLPD
ncbi:MAG: transposase [Bacteroidetes bacterium]|nr:transposase [Bacteroidota bacterium]